MLMAMPNAEKWLSRTKSGHFFKKWSSRAKSGIFEKWSSHAYFGHLKEISGFLTETLWQACQVACFKRQLCPLILCTFFHDFIHIHSPWAGADNPLGPKFWCQQEGIITMVICCMFKKNLFNLWLYTHLHDLINLFLFTFIGVSSHLIGWAITPFARSSRRSFFAYHYAVNHPHTNIILPWFSIPLILKCATKILKIGLQIKI